MVSSIWIWSHLLLSNGFLFSMLLYIQLITTGFWQYLLTKSSRLLSSKYRLPLYLPWFRETSCGYTLRIFRRGGLFNVRFCSLFIDSFRSFNVSVYSSTVMSFTALLFTFRLLWIPRDFSTRICSQIFKTASPNEMTMSSQIKLWRGHFICTFQFKISEEAC